MRPGTIEYHRGLWRVELSLISAVLFTFLLLFLSHIPWCMSWLVASPVGPPGLSSLRGHDLHDQLCCSDIQGSLYSYVLLLEMHLAEQGMVTHTCVWVLKDWDRRIWSQPGQYRKSQLNNNKRLRWLRRWWLSSSSICNMSPRTHVKKSVYHPHPG